MEKKYLVCPYCGKILSEENNVCCGEAGHGEWKTEAYMCECEETYEFGIRHQWVCQIHKEKE